jgi:hypothetical protein
MTVKSNIPSSLRHISSGPKQAMNGQLRMAHTPMNPPIAILPSFSPGASTIDSVSINKIALSHYQQSIHWSYSWDNSL